MSGGKSDDDKRINVPRPSKDDDFKNVDEGATRSHGTQPPPVPPKRR
jgi:hypothetical protein